MDATGCACDSACARMHTTTTTTISTASDTARYPPRAAVSPQPSPIPHTQVHKCLAGVNASLLPIRSMANMGAGAADLVLLPLKHMRAAARVAPGGGMPSGRRGTCILRAFCVRTAYCEQTVCIRVEAVFAPTVLLCWVRGAWCVCVCVLGPVQTRVARASDDGASAGVS